MYARMHPCISASMHVCMYACMHVCKYVCMHLCIYACMHVWIYACMELCLYACMHVCTYACMHVCTSGCMVACMFACMHVCIRSGRVGSVPISKQVPGPCTCRWITIFIARLEAMCIVVFLTWICRVFSRHKLEFAIGFPRHPGTCELIPFLPTLLLATSAFEPWGGDVKSTWLSTQAFFCFFSRMRSEGFSFWENQNLLPFKMKLCKKKKYLW